MTERATVRPELIDRIAELMLLQQETSTPGMTPLSASPPAMAFPSAPPQAAMPPRAPQSVPQQWVTTGPVDRLMQTPDWMKDVDRWMNEPPSEPSSGRS